MATPPAPLVPWPDLVAVLVPGDGRYRFCVAAIALAPGDWVAVSGPFGAEPAQVTRGAADVLAGSDPEQRCAVERRLDPDEVAGIIDRSARALELTGDIVRIAAEAAPELQVTNLRYTLSGEAICGCAVPEGGNAGAFLDQVSRFLAVPAHLESRADSALFGGLGKRAGQTCASDARAFDERLHSLGAWPRLGNRVRGGGVDGQLQGVSVRHGEARVRGAEGEDQIVPVERLEP